LIGKGVEKEKPVSLTEVYKILRERKKIGELGYEQRLAYDYAQKFKSLSPKKAENLMKELLELGKIREHQAVSIIDLMPETEEDVRLIFAKERTPLDDEDIRQILEIVRKYKK